MEVLFFIGRIVFSIVFLMSGMSHLMQTEGMAGFAGSKGLPAPRVTVLVSGVWIIVGALSVAAGVYGRIGSAMLVVFLASTTFLMHNFWTEDDDASRQNEMVQFLKDLSLGGAALALASTAAWPLVIVD